MENKTILITGTSTGFGRLTALTLVDNGYKVWASMRNTEGKNKENAQTLKKEAEGKKGTLEVIELDVSIDESVQKAINHIEKTDGKLDVVVNNAGVGSMALLEDFTIDKLKAIFEINVYGIFRVSKAVLPIMKKQKDGLIINISSALGRICLPTFTYYNATKWAVEGLVQSLKYELAALGIDTVIIEPGAYPTTNFMSNMASLSVDETEKANQYGNLFKMHEIFQTMVEQSIKDGTVNNPQNVASAVLNLIETEKGKRPMRTVVDEGFEQMLDPYNKTLDDMQSGIMESFGIGNLMQPK